MGRIGTFTFHFSWLFHRMHRLFWPPDRGLCWLGGEGPFHMIYTLLFKNTYIPRCAQEYNGTQPVLIWIISDHCLGSTGFFHLFAGWVWRGTVFLSFMSSCYLFSLPVARDFLSLKCFMHARTLAKHGQDVVYGQCRALCRVPTQSEGGHRAAVLLVGPLQHGMVSPEWWRRGFGVPTVEVPAWHASRVLALLLLAGARRLLESLAAVPTSLCAGGTCK